MNDNNPRHTAKVFKFDIAASDWTVKGNNLFMCIKESNEVLPEKEKVIVHCDSTDESVHAIYMAHTITAKIIDGKHVEFRSRGDAIKVNMKLSILVISSSSAEPVYIKPEDKIDPNIKVEVKGSVNKVLSLDIDENGNRVTKITDKPEDEKPKKKTTRKTTTKKKEESTTTEEKPKRTRKTTTKKAEESKVEEEKPKKTTRKSTTKKKDETTTEEKPKRTKKSTTKKQEK